MNRFVWWPTLVAVTLTAALRASAADVERPVNLVQESGKDVGPCAAGGTLLYPPAPYKGIAYFLPKADADIAAAHRALADAEPTWIREFEGPSASNRLYIGRDARRVLVFSTCMPRDCGTHRLYGAYDLRDRDYGLRIEQSGRVRMLGSLPPASLDAIQCAQEHTDRLRAQAAGALRGGAR